MIDSELFLVLKNSRVVKSLYWTFINLLKAKSDLLYIRNQNVPRSKHFPPRL